MWREASPLLLNAEFDTRTVRQVHRNTGIAGVCECAKVAHSSVKIKSLPRPIPEAPLHIDQCPLNICGTRVEVPVRQVLVLGVA